MIDAIFFLLTSSIAQLNTNAPIRTFRPIPTSTINFITGIITRPPRTSTTTVSSTSSFLTTTLSSTTLSSTTLSSTTLSSTILSSTILSSTTEPLDEDDQSIRDVIIVSTIWGIIALIILYVCCKKKKEIQPIEPPSLEYVKEKSYSSHIYAEVDEHPYEMPVIKEDQPYGVQVSAI